jgi:hypothetical protein
MQSEPREDSSGSRELSRPANILLIVAIGTALLLPCFWQPHIQAGDLSSHLYNAWLAGKIRDGAAPGLAVVTTWTNVLSDWFLEALLHRFGVVVAERLVVSAAVLLFFWGAFCVINVASGRRPWFLAPCLAMLAYGLVFHFGFLNYYVSTGLCLWVMALLWRPLTWRVLLALPLIAMAVLAHVVPVIWMFAVVGYLRGAERVAANRRLLLLIGGFTAVVLLRIMLVNRFPHRWSFSDVGSLSGVLGMIGADQVWLFGPKYLIVAGGLLYVWGVLFLERFDRGGMLADPVVHLWLLHIAAFLLMPSAIQFPQYNHPLAYIPQRISLFTAVLLCIMLAGAGNGRGMTRLSALIAIMFFVFLYVDDRAFNVVESEVARLVENLPPDAEVVAALSDSGARLNAMTHVMDRACIGRCFSYGNYEPATAQFRIRIRGPNQVVAPTMVVAQEIEKGEHIVTTQEAPLYSVCLCDAETGRLCLRTLRAKATTCSVSFAISPRLWSKVPRL